MTTIDRIGSPHCIRPLERHHFIGGPNDFNCASCGRPRAMHIYDGFVIRSRDRVGGYAPLGRVIARDWAMGFQNKKRRLELC